MSNLVLEEARRCSRPFPEAHAEREIALINAAIAEAAAELGTTVNCQGTLHHVAGEHYAVFGPLAYTLQCEMASDSEGWAWETIPAVIDQHLIGQWPRDEAGTILHLQRLLWIDGDFVVAPRWEAIWVPCLWEQASAIGEARPIRADGLGRTSCSS
jgi:hypothetical protein